MEVVLKGLVGSHAYGLATPESDEDWLGIYIEPTVDFLGLNPGERDSKVTKNPDTSLHEIGKFCRLALACNPTATELLWLYNYEVETELGALLRAQRTCFLSANLVKNAYFGYATQQFKRLRDRGDTFSSQTGKRTQKHARHLFRLLRQGYELYKTGHLTVKLDNPAAVRFFGECVEKQARDGIYSYAENTLAQYEAAFERTTPAIPDAPAKLWIDLILRKARVDNLLQDMLNSY